VVDARLILIGPVPRRVFFAPEPGQHIDAVRRHPEWARDLLGVDRATRPTPSSPQELFVAETPAPAAHPRASASPLRELMAQVRTMSAERGAVARCAADPRGAARPARLRARHARARAGGRALDVSERHLRRLIRRTAGFSPKHLQRVARLGRAIAVADRQAHPDWAAIAGENGYFDQPHMIEDFRALVGRTPAELFRERRLQQAMAEISNPP